MSGLVRILGFARLGIVVRCADADGDCNLDDCAKANGHGGEDGGNAVVKAVMIVRTGIMVFPS